MILNVGSLCIDHVYSVPQLSPPGHTIASTDYQIFPGGKGLNQSLAAARAGARVSHFGCVGPDGNLLLDTLTEADVNTSAVKQLSTASGHAVIQVDAQGQNAIVIHGGANRLLSMAEVAHAIERLEADDWLLLQNEVNDLPTILRTAHTAKCKVALNVAPADADCRTLNLSAVDVLVVNEQEAAMLSGASDENGSLQTLRAKYPTLSIVLTRGVNGLLYDTPNGSGELGAFAVDAVDETAAGDAFVGYFLASLAGGEVFEDALLRGSAAGALATTQSGAATSIPSSEKVARLILEADIQH